ncbi:hypothetical protein BV25DRAFT_1895581 [Artomyces pyxidatus]|uniref:Uncharacterized protein n=1 Tax=Artomyces pyxidatus TaxID=48021 RepID=A0ACB8SER7_9AGAM|nr:hypothetical protein BV25DRAFT_1895581 [Artomyces pyxidatus]
MAESTVTHRSNSAAQAPTRRSRVPKYESLYPHEAAWRDRQFFLESKGYMLRPRLRPGWTPSWHRTGKHDIFSEDAYWLPLRPSLVDATRMSDGKAVYIKRVCTGDQESTIAKMLYGEPLRRDGRNHSVPILDEFQDDQDESISYMVMPLLRLIYDPPFAAVGEIVDFADQILQGLVFMHEQGVAHRDCSAKNLMMDADAMYPRGFHPVRTRFLPNGVNIAFYTRRPRLLAGVKYYFVDYGISSHILPDQPRLALGLEGRDEEVPELSEIEPYDPFKVDIYTIGNVFRRNFYDKFSNVEFLRPIIDSMVQDDPARRPTAEEALAQWQSIRRNVSTLHRVWRLRRREEPGLASIIRDIIYFYKSCLQLWRWLFNRQ